MTNNVKNYHQAMMRNDLDTCIQIEKETGLYGHPPEVVSSVLADIDQGMDLGEALDKYFGGDS